MKVPGSYGKEVTLELLGPLVKPKQSAVVLNARSGMEVGMLGKAKMNVVGIYSEAWNKFPGGVVPDSKDELAKTAAQELEREMGELTAEDMAAFTAREAVVKELEEDLAEENEKETAKDLGEIPAVESAEAGDKAGPEEQVDRAMEMEEGGQTGEVA